ncbi:MAG: double-strand break repair helicase AddA [Alphaproteobacteria bacterium CG11_big_fil_rev_8_21_14_0_20_44_7]|nr:MAG: double-strand break repair helicase AddA [Alphaproteobacteria bacterium CG11_big_fil_rev_8_21_14_0_20_44_7]
MSITTAQKLASEPAISARVSANAGTGKTSVLTNRVLRLLLDGVAPGKVLCLTYTKAAAAEMSARITQRLKIWVKAGDAELVADLQDLIGKLPDAALLKRARSLFVAKLNSMPPPRIQTIHSFCQEVLQRFSIEANVPTNFKVLDDISSKELLKEARQRLLSKKQDDKKLAEVIDYIAENSSETKFYDVLNEVISKRNKIRKLGLADFNFENLYIKHNVAPNTLPKDLIAEMLNFDKSAMNKYTEALEKYGKKIAQKHLVKLEQIILQRDGLAYANFYFKDDNSEYTLKHLAGNKEVSENFAGFEEFMATEFERLGGLLDKYRSLKLLKFTECVYALAAQFLQIYDDLKFRQGRLDYEDLIYFTKELLNKSNAAQWVLYKLDGGIEHILIDEAQDTSPDQWAIAEILTDEFFSGENAHNNNRTIFIVGDEKQSIYRFQGADPKSFGRVSTKLAQKATIAEKEWHEIPLDISFRSVDVVLQLTDKIFNDENYRKYVSFSGKEILHNISRQGQAGRVELWPLITESGSKAIPNWEIPLTHSKYTSAEAEIAEKIASQIKGWLDNGRKLASQDRKIEPGDIMILLRKRSSLADSLIRKLKAKNIPVSGADRMVLTEHIAVQDLLALCKFLLLPQDDYSLACALKSPLFGISEDELFGICRGRGKGFSIISYLEKESKYNELYKELNALLQIVDFLPPSELFIHMLDIMGGRKKLISRLGDEVNDPLDELLAHAEYFESNHTSSLQEFIYWLENGVSEIKRDMEQQGNEVRIMTIHGAKGLQAPIVFLPDTTSNPVDKSKNPNLLEDDEGYFYAPPNSKLYNKFAMQLVDEYQENALEEYFRLLYVAITRAEDELYICGKISKKDEENEGKLKENCWYNVIKTKMEELGESDGDVLVFKSEQNVTPNKSMKKQMVKARAQIPQYLYEEAAQEQGGAFTEMPTEKNPQNLDAIARGVKIHKFLEFYNSNIEVDKGELANKFFEDKQIAEEILQVLEREEFQEIFDKEKSFAEVGIAGIVEGKQVNGQIDRLLVTDNEVVIIDFKTSAEKPQAMPKKYIEQMRGYKSLISDIYPNHVVTAKILWTSVPMLESVDIA